MKKIIFLLLISSPVFGEGPLYRHKDNIANLEFQNVYQDIREKSSSKLFSSSNTWTGINIFTSSTSIKGTITNDSASAGFVGEYISSVTASQRPVGTSSQYFDVLAINLTAGDWDVSSNTYWIANGATVVYVESGIGTATGNNSAGLVSGDTYSGSSPPVATYQVSVSIPSVRHSLSSNTTIYLKGISQYSVATPRVLGRISARRVR